MAEQKREPELKELLPKSGLVVSEKGELTEVFCKPKIMPLKSMTLQKLEQMEAEVAAANAQAAAHPATSAPRDA